MPGKTTYKVYNPELEYLLTTGHRTEKEIGKTPVPDFHREGQFHLSVEKAPTNFPHISQGEKKKNRAECRLRLL